MEQKEMPETPFEVKLQKFLKLLHKLPSVDQVRINKEADQAKYLPISLMEMKLDELFFGLWETTGFSFQKIGEEVAGQLELRLYHPVAKSWITRTGVGAVVLKENNVPIPLERALPNLKAECIKNAARSLGKAFGRDLNREFEGTYQPIIKAA